MTICGKSNFGQILRSDLKEIGETQGIKKPLSIVDEIIDVVSQVDKFMDVRIPSEVIEKVKGNIDLSCKSISPKRRPLDFSEDESEQKKLGRRSKTETIKSSKHESGSSGETFSW